MSLLPSAIVLGVGSAIRSYAAIAKTRIGRLEKQKANVGHEITGMAGFDDMQVIGAEFVAAGRSCDVRGGWI